MSVALSKRKASLDIIRIIALGLVLLIHCVENTWHLVPGKFEMTSQVGQIAVMLLYSIGRICVPLFLFLTGYLMLDRKYKKEDVWTFYKAKVLHLLIIAFIWTGIYYLFAWIVLGRHFSVYDFIKQFTFTADRPVAPHLWYMPAIIGLYLFIPFVANALKSMDKKVIKLFIALATCYLFVVPTINVLARSIGGLPVRNNVELNYLGGMCGTFMVLGYLTKRYMNVLNSKIKTSGLVIVCVASIVLCTIMNYFLFVGLKYNYMPWYDSIFILFASTSLFIVLLRLLDKAKPRQYLYSASTAVLGCYLVHYIFIYIYTRIVGGFGLAPGWMYMIGLAFFVSIGTVIVVYALRKFERLAWYTGLRL